MARNSRDREIYPITIRELQVDDIEDITPGMRRITLTGEQLRAHSAFGVDAPPLVSDGFDDDIRIIFPDPATGERPHPITREDATVLWQEEVKDLFRTYTVRSFDASQGRLVVDFARHGQGLAEDWSARARPGDPLYIAGPKSCAALPTHTPWLLMVGDETALPAIARCIESLPAGYRAMAIIEVATRAHVQRLEFEAQVDIHWQVRDEGGDFVAKVTELYGEHPEWAAEPAAMPYVWAAGEAGRLKVIRRWVRALGIPRENVEITGYWRAMAPVQSEAGATATQAESAGQVTGTPSQGDSEGAETGAVTSHRNALVELHELIEMGSAILVRQAVGLGIFGLIDEGADRVDQLAEATGLQQELALRIARYLEAVGLVTLSADVALDSSAEDVADQRAVRIGLTALGSELANPDSPVRDWITGPAAAKTAALGRLGQALQNPADTGEHRWDYIVQTQPQLAVEEHEQAASSAQWSAPAAAEILSSKLLARQDAGSLRCAVGGPAAAVYADEILRKIPQANAVVLGSFSEAEDDARISVGATTAAMTEPGASAEDVMLRDIAPRRRDRARYSALHAPTVGHSGGDARRADWAGTVTTLCEQVDAVVLVDPWRRWPAIELQQLVAAVLRSGAQLFLVTPVLQESGAEDHDYQEDLSRLVLYGSQLPTARVIAKHLAAVGAVVRSKQPVGWSAQLFEVGRGGR